MTPFLQGLDEGEELSVIDVIVSLSQGEDSGMVGARMVIPIRVLLHEYSSRCSEGGIGHNEEGFSCIWHFDHQGRKEDLFEFNECVVLFLSPLEGDPLLG